MKLILKFICTLIVFTHFVTPVKGQDERVIPYGAYKNITKGNTHKNIAAGNVVFLIDTLELPFLDDFSKNRFKDFNPNTSLGTKIDSLRPFFTFNFQIVPRIEFRLDTTYNLFFNSVSGSFDSLPQIPDTVQFFTSNTAIGTATDTLLVWRTISLVDSLGFLDSLLLAPDSFINNNVDTFTFLTDHPYYKWISTGALHNYTFAQDAPSLGMVTFDGTNEDGFPYDISTPGTFGLADELVTKPINLNGRNNVYLSFWYKSTGFGNKPEKFDSLILSYKLPDENWRRMWGDSGAQNDEWRQIIMNFPDSLCQKGVQFKFQNYATLSGAFDHWHINYFYLNDNRNETDLERDDIAYTNWGQSFIKNYTSMPYKHFKSNSAAFIKEEMLFNFNNLSDNQKVISSTFHTIDRISGQQVFSLANPVQQPDGVGSPNAPANAFFNVRHRSIPSNIFPITTDSVMDYIVVQSITTTPDVLRDNDTLKHNQKFDTFYAYDDGTAEQAYKIRDQPGAQLALKYFAEISDTLKGILVNFPAVETETNFRRVRFKVWKNLTEDPIYESILINVPTTALNRFYRFEFDEDIIIDGEFYIGWQQFQRLDLWVGFDINNDASVNLSYNIDGLWINSSLPGALMFRADFGKANIDPIGIETLKSEEVEKIKIYPNPNNGLFRIVAIDTFENIEIFNINGQQVNFDIQGDQLMIPNATSGLYLVKGITKSGKLGVSKIQIIK